LVQNITSGLRLEQKAEMLIALSTVTEDDTFIICNGYKDDEYIEMAMWARKMGRKVFIVVEKPSEVDLIVKWAKTSRFRGYFKKLSNKISENLYIIRLFTICKIFR